jgi:hypothetical protein
MPSILVPTLSAVAVIATLAENPDWYPRQCGTIDYCAAVGNVTWMPATEGNPPRMLIASVHGSAIVRNGFTVMVSADARIHVCMRFDPFGDLEVTCLLVPPQML